MSQWVLKANGNVVPHRSHRPLTTAELHSPVEIKKQKVFDELIKAPWGDSINLPKDLEERDDRDFEYDFEYYEDNDKLPCYEDNDELPRNIPDIEDTVDAEGNLLDQQPSYDKMINAEVMMQQGDQLVNCTVKGCTVGPDGKIHGTFDENPFLNTLMHSLMDRSRSTAQT